MVVQVLIHKGYTEVEIERICSPTIKPKPENCKTSEVAVQTSPEPTRGPPRRTRSPGIFITNSTGLVSQGCRRPSQNVSPLGSARPTSTVKNNFRDRGQPSPNRERKSTTSKHLVSTSRTESKCESSRQSRSSKRQINLMNRRDSAQQSIIQRPALDVAAVLHQTKDPTNLTISIDSAPQAKQNRKNQSRRKQWKSMFRRSRYTADERSDSSLDARDDFPSIVDDEHSNKKKIAIWGRCWNKKRKKFCSVPFEENPSDVGKKFIDFGCTMNNIEMGRKEKCSVDTTLDGETKDKAAKVFRSNQPDIVLKVLSEEDCNRPVREEDCNRPVREELELILSSESSFSLSLPTVRDESIKRMSRPVLTEEMTEYPREDSVLEHEALSSEQRIDSREESILSKQYRGDRQLFRRESDSKENFDEERESQIPQSNFRTLTARNEEREKPHPARKTHVHYGMLALSSCYRDTTSLPLQLPSARGNISTRTGWSEMSQDWVLEAHKSLQTGRMPRDEGGNASYRGSLVFPSCTRGTASFPARLSPEGDDINEKFVLTGTTRGRKNGNDHAFGMSVKKNFQIDEKTVYQYAHKKSSTEAASSCHQDITTLSSQHPSVETARNANIALSDISNERFGENQLHRINETPVQNSFQIDHEPNYQGRNILALLVCRHDTTSSPLQHPAVERGIHNELKTKETLNSLRCLSVDGMQSRAGVPKLKTVAIKVKCPSPLGALLQQKWSESDPDLAVPQHHLLSFSSFSHVSGEAPNPLASHMPSNFTRGLNCMYGGSITNVLPSNFTREEESNSFAYDPRLFVDASLTSSKSLEVSEYIEMAEMALKDDYSDLSSFSWSYASSHADSQETFSSSEGYGTSRNVTDTVGGTSSERLRQIAKELKIDPTELLRRLEAGQDIKNLIHDELLRRNGSYP